jgi:uncharacterized transporter YbjL
MRKATYKFKLFAIVILAIGIVVNGVFITLYNVDKSVNIGVVTEEMQKLMAENDKLNEKISVGDSLTNFLGQSESAGYKEGVKILYFDQAEAVAQAR